MGPPDRDAAPSEGPPGPPAKRDLILISRPFLQQLKLVLSKDFLEKKNTKWVDILPGIIEPRNSTPHTSLDSIMPKQAISDSKKREHVMHLNVQNAHDNRFMIDLKEGDKVRLDYTS